MPNDDERFPTSDDHPEGARSFRVKKHVYGRDRVLVVTYKENLFQSQWLTLQNDIRHALERLEELPTRLEDRRRRLIKGGRAPTVASVQKQRLTRTSLDN